VNSSTANLATYWCTKMRARLVSSILVMLMTLNACTNKQLYQAVQSNQKIQCNQPLNDDERSECLGGLNPNYEDYKRERDKLLNEEK